MATPESLALLRQDLISHSKTLNDLITSEARRNDQDKARDELEALKEKHLNERLDRIEASIKAVYGLGKWLLTAAGSTLILAVVTFTVRGGFFNG